MRNTCSGGHVHFCNEIADGEVEVRRSVRRLVHEGADYIKIMASGGGTAGTLPGVASYSIDEIHAAVHEAYQYAALINVIETFRILPRDLLLDVLRHALKIARNIVPRARPTALPMGVIVGPHVIVGADHIGVF